MALDNHSAKTLGQGTDPVLLRSNGFTIQNVPYFLHTLFLFTKSDFKTVMLPQSVFALVLALSKAGSVMAPTSGPMKIILRIPYMLTWLWLHLLVTTVANQRLPEAVLEDKLNKPWRPLPAARLSPSEAQNLLRAAVQVSLAVSLLFGSFLPSVTLMVFLWLYNDLNSSSTSPLLRNVLTALGLSCFGWGAITTLLSGNITVEGQTILKNWIVLMGVAIATTVQAQDFPDTVGDTARGRRTIPVIYGSSVARWSLAVPAIVWSIVLPAFWGVSPLVWSVIIAVGGCMVTVTGLRWDQKSNELVWQLWCLWQTTIYLLPLFQ